MFAMQEAIRPSADLRNHYNEISKQCREGKEAVIITVNGRGDVYKRQALSLYRIYQGRNVEQIPAECMQ